MVASFPGLPRHLFFSLRSVVEQREKTGKAWEHLSHEWCLVDARWTLGGGGPNLTNSCIIHKVSFLPVESSIVDLMNVWSPGHRWSARWWSLVGYLNVDPAPTSTLCPPDVIHVIGILRPRLFFAAFPLPCMNANWKTKNWWRPGNKATTTLYDTVALPVRVDGESSLLTTLCLYLLALFLGHHHFYSLASPHFTRGRSTLSGILSVG